MDEYLNVLKGTTILRKKGILDMQAYIAKKYPEKSLAKRADILSHAIHGIVDENLKDIGEAHRKEIKNCLLKSILLEGKDSILLLDVFDACAKYEKKDASFLAELTHWLQRHVQSNVTFEDVQASLNKIQTPLLFPHQEELEVEIDSSPKKEVLCCQENLGVKKWWLFLAGFRKIIAVSTFFTLLILIFTLHSFLKQSKIVALPSDAAPTSLQKNDISLKSENSKKNISPHLPLEFTYQNINKEKLRDFLLGKNSLLAEEPYFSTIIKSGEEFNVNPLLLFAISGQEEAFVPKSEKNAAKIANNPFNVFHSWREYNTTIQDSSRIAARTISNLTLNRPQEADFIKWLNHEYAEDKNWYKGVKKYFEIFKKECEINN